MVKETQYKCFFVLELDEAAAKAKQDGKISKKPLPVTSKLLQKKPGQQTTKENLPKASKPPSKRPASVTKPGLKKPVIKSTYSASYRGPPTAKSLLRPTSSRGSASKYLDSVLKKDDRRGTHSKVDHKEGGNIPPRTEPETGGKNSQKSKTNTRNDSDEQEGDARKKDSQISFPSGEESAVSSKAPEKADIARRSADSSEDSQRLSMNEKGRKPRSVIEIPGQSPGLSKPAESFETEEIDAQEDSIDPLVDGVESGLPGKYRKLKATSVRLYSELRKIAEKDEGKSSLPWRNFVERLEAGFDSGHSSPHRRVQEKSNALLGEHEKLSLLTSAVVARSNDLKDDSSWQDIYKCYRHWQIVLSKFNELQKRTQQLLEVEEQLNECCPCGNCGAFEQDHPRDTSIVQEWNKGCVLLSRWIPEEIQHCASVELCSGFRQHYGTMDFTYSSVKELRELVGLHHDVQLLCLELHVKRFVGDRLLPLLEKIDPLDSEFLRLYRVVHGLLCGGGKVFPAMVIDNI